MAQKMKLNDWWNSIYPYAVELEKNITTSPLEQDKTNTEHTIQTLEAVLKNIQNQAYPEEANLMRDHLLRAITYLIHAYQEMGNNNENEADFYYSTALTNVAQLHHQLVQNGFAN